MKRINRLAVVALLLCALMVCVACSGGGSNAQKGWNKYVEYEASIYGSPTSEMKKLLETGNTTVNWVYEDSTNAYYYRCNIGSYSSYSRTQATTYYFVYYVEGDYISVYQAEYAYKVADSITQGVTRGSFVK